MKLFRYHHDLRISSKLPVPLRSLFEKYRTMPLCLCVLFSYAAGAGHSLISPLISLILATLLAVFTAAAALFLRPSRSWLIFFCAATAAILTIFGFELVLEGAEKFGGNGFQGLHTLHHLGVFSVQVSGLSLLLSYSMFQHHASGFDRILGSVGGYFLLALIWSSIYSLILVWSPCAIIETSNGEGLATGTIHYYSLVTQTTQGYGDFIPKEPSSRYAAAFQGATGTLYLAILVAGLLGIVQRNVILK